MNKPRANWVKCKGRALNIPPFLFLFLWFQSATRKIGGRDLLNTHARHRLKLIWITKVYFSTLCVYIYLCLQPSKKKIQKNWFNNNRGRVLNHKFSSVWQRSISYIPQVFEIIKSRKIGIMFNIKRVFLAIILYFSSLVLIKCFI